MSKVNNTYQRATGFFSCLQNSVTFLLPFSIFSGTVLLAAYISELLHGRDLDAIGESGIIAKILFSLYSLLSEFFPIVAAVSLTLCSSYIGALPAVLAAEAVCNRGYSILSPEGSIDASGGLLGAVFSALLGVVSYKVMQKFLENPKHKSSFDMLSAFGALIISLCGAYLFTSFAKDLGYLTTSLMALWADNELIICIIIGLLLNLNPGGASYIGVFAFSKAMFAAERSFIFAAMLSATMVPQLALSIASVVFRAKFSRTEKIIFPVCFIFALTGINTVALSQYVRNPLLHSVAYCTGGVLSAVLCLIFGCTASGFEGGILSLKGAESPLLIVASAIAGGIAGAVILGLCRQKNQVSEDT